MMKRPRQFSEKHLDRIRQLPCLICLNNIMTEAAHIRMADPRIAKPLTGGGTKPDDKYTVPLCGDHHREQHKTSERAFWDKYKLDPILISLALYSCKDHGEAEDLIRRIVDFR